MALPLFQGLFKNRRLQQAGQQVYQWALTSAQRHFPQLFEQPAEDDAARVARFEAIALLMVVALWRLKSAGPAYQKVAQAAYDEMFHDFDAALRESGVGELECHLVDRGDLAVSHRIRKYGAAFNGRLSSYTQALDGADQDALQAALVRNMECDAAAAEEIAAWVLPLAAALDVATLLD